ncbi:sugar phosphate nucleotidyltransferase [Formosa maritima]|uniref:Nucleotidyltransferase n=1 Tax=Formosa maritima TaxID=2592046 RepID=A0A5D0GJA1_9FLAO|nr:sugar phosphate nucleotidyltransferase [Formosa maritima]TYA59054.1 nucleotidyltransferase [Formosa maritima]
MKQKTIAFMAAGMGSRFGGLKQVHEVVNNYALLDFSIYDALQAGFNHLVFIIREEILHVFEIRYKNSLPKYVQVDFVIQDTIGLPERKKPWGTGHALLSLKNTIHSNFALINADDFYGREAYKLMYNALYENDKHENYFIGYQLKNTLSDFGTVSRGVCVLNKDQELLKITEHTNIDKANLQVSLETIVSMNFWGFTTDIFNIAEFLFKTFLEKHKDSEAAEFYIPTLVDFMLEKNKGTFNMLKTSTKWFGITYKEDEPMVKKHLQEFISKGEYPVKLW